jgi:autotransporter-associated beta strand protein
MYASTGCASPTLSSFYIDGEFATNSSFTSGAENVPVSNVFPTVYVPVGDYFEFGVSAVVTNNPNSTAGDAWDLANQAKGNPAQPANLGIGTINYVVGSTDTNAAFLAPVEDGSRGTNEYFSTAVLPNSGLALLSDPGDVQGGNGSVGINQPIFQGAFQVNPDTATGVAQLALMSGSTATASQATPVFVQLAYQALNTGLVGLLPSSVGGAGDDYWVPNSPGSVNSNGQITSDASYSLDEFSGSGIVNDPPVLAVRITPGVTWNGQADHTTWNTSAANWNSGGNPPSAYANSDIAMFTDSAPSNAISVTLNTTVSPDEVLVSSNTNNYTIGGSGAIGGSAEFVKDGASTLTLGTKNTYTGPTFVSAGTLIVAAAGALPTGNSLTISNSAIVKLAGGTGEETLSSLAIAAGAALDITNNHVILDYSGSDPKSTILQYLASASNGGHWNGPGISSSTAAGASAYGVGFADGADGTDHSLSSGQIEVAYALYGDINLDGVVNSIDFGTFAANFGKSVANGWEQGDFTYSGVVNSTDFGLLAANFGKSASGADIVLPASDWAALDAFSSAAGFSTEVPEPVGATVVALFGVLLLRSRKPTGPSSGC